MKKLLIITIILLLAFPLMAQENPRGLTLAMIKKAAIDSGFEVSDDFFFATDLNYNRPIAGITVEYETYVEYEDGGSTIGEAVSILEFRNVQDAQAFEKDNDTFFYRDTRTIRNGRFAVKVSYYDDEDEDMRILEDNMFADFKLLIQGKPIQ